MSPVTDVRVIRETVPAPVQVIRETVAAPVSVIRETVRTGPPGGGASIETVAGGSVFGVEFDGVWPERPTARTDVRVLWIGPDPSPDVVEPPSVAGMYSGDARFVVP